MPSAAAELWKGVLMALDISKKRIECDRVCRHGAGRWFILGRLLLRTRPNRRRLRVTDSYYASGRRA